MKTVEQKINETVKTVNDLIDKGKTAVMNEELDRLLKKHNMNELIFVGCSEVKGSGFHYIELPYRNIEEEELGGLYLKYKLIEDLFVGDSNG